VALAHVEAGLRSRRLDMPEEVNRIVADRLSQLLFAPTDEAVRNLRAEGMTDGVHQVGDVMYDAFRLFRARAEEASRIVDVLGLERRGYFLATVHRAANTDDPTRLRAICAALDDIGAPVVFPVHPRTRRLMHEHTIPAPHGVRILQPIGYLAMLELCGHAAAVLTDSGGVQKEAYWAGVPCITLRAETEWGETVSAGWNTLADADTERIRAAAIAAMDFDRTRPRPDFYGAGDAAVRIAGILARGVPDIPTSRPDARPGLAPTAP